MKATNYINNLENTIVNLKKELDDLINKVSNKSNNFNN